jgi:hypothetical protein
MLAYEWEATRTVVQLLTCCVEKDRANRLQACKPMKHRNLFAVFSCLSLLFLSTAFKIGVKIAP